MTTLADRIIPVGNYSGTLRIGFGPGQGGNPLLIPDGTQSCDIQVFRCTSLDPTTWPSKTVFLEVIPEVFDGINWIESGRAKSAGGISFKKDGVTEEPFFTSGGSLPNATARLYRCTFVITGGTLRSGANVIVD